MALLATLLVLSACISEPLVNDKDSDYGDGKLTPITLAIRGDRFTGEAATPTRAEAAQQPAVRALSAADEAKITYLNLLVFDADGAVVLNESFNELTLTDGAYRLRTETLPGSGMQFYIIANADAATPFAENLPNALKAVTKLDGLKALLLNLKESTDGLNRTDRLLMMGNATINVTKPYREEIPLTLTFLSAKVTVKLMDKIPEGLKIEIKNWDIVNVPKKSYLLGRDTEDAVSKTKEEDYLTTASKFAFENSAEKEWSQTFYLLENRQGGRVARADPTHAADKYPGMKVDDNDQRGKAWYAPVYATYLLVYGTHIKDGNTNDIFYKIYLGENAVNDYNLCRGKHYQYNVTINGLNNINVDTNVDWGNASFTVDKSDNFLLDAHPDFRVLRIGGTAVDAETPAYATVEVLDATGQIASDWLKVSPLNLYRHSVKQVGNAHQQFASGDGVGRFVRPQYAPVPSTTAEFKNATFAMTRKLTKIPFEQVAVCSYQDIVIYADELDTPDATRAGKVRVTYYKGDEQTGQQTYDISQTGPLRVSDDLYVERYEEAAMTLQPDGAVGAQQTSSMQWGYNSATLYSANDRFSNGNYLTANAVYNTVAARNEMTAPQWVAGSHAAYREKYPSTGGVVTEPTSLSTTGKEYYYPVLTGSVMPSSYFHPVFNASAARYCHEKNRDADGDGIISQNETFWYLPSFADMYEIKKSDLSGLNGTYWTSTEESNTKSWAFTFPQKTMAAVDKTVTNRVRCVRGKGAVLPQATIKSTEEDQTKINLTYTAKVNGAFDITDGTGLTWTVTSDAADWLTIATTTTGTGAAKTQKGESDKTLHAYVATINTTGDYRKGTLTLTRGGMNEKPAKTITVSQKYQYRLPTAHKGWAGCNIYWDPTFSNSDGTTGRLTFTDMGDTSLATIQGVYFQWGSLVALSAVGTYSTTSILFSPTGNKNFAYASIPNAGTTNITANRNRSYLLEIHDATRDIGDICKYISDKGWAPGATESKKWRMPTSNEYEAAANYTRFPATGGFTAVSSNDSNGLMKVTSGYTRGANTRFTASGYRYTDGSFEKVGISCYCWSSSPLDGSAYRLYLSGSEIDLASLSNRRVGYPVRCVRE